MGNMSRKKGHCPNHNVNVVSKYCFELYRENISYSVNFDLCFSMWLLVPIIYHEIMVNFIVACLSLGTE